MPDTRVKRSIQLPLLKSAALQLAERCGETIIVSNLPITEVRLTELLIWLTPFGPTTNLDVWDESRGGAKVLNMTWGPDGKIDAVSIRRGDWEERLLVSARGALQ